MKKSFVLILVLIHVAELYAQVTPRNILARMYTAQQVQQELVPQNQYHPYPTTPAEWKEALPDSILKALVKAGEASLDYAFRPVTATVSLDFVRSGDRERHRGVAYNKRYALTDLILAESIEGKGRFVEAILNGVWSICEESYWGVPAHISNTGLPDVENPVVDLFSAETAALMGLANYFVGDKLDAINPLVRKRMYYETNHRIFKPMLTDTDQYKWMSKTQSVNNWNPWIMSNWMSATLMLEKDEARRAHMIHQAMLGLDLYLNGLGEDGGCDEGPSYWTAAGASVYDCLELLDFATKGKVQIYDLPLIQKMGSYFYKVHIDGHYFVNFADADPKLRPDGLLLYRFGKALRDERMVNMGHWAFRNFPERTLEVNGHHRPRNLENLLTIQKMSAPSAAYVPVRDAWISDIQVMTARADNGFVLATHGGHNSESHNHNDVGDFLLYANGEPIIIDAGRGNYTSRTFSPQRYDLWFTQSQHHNLPIVNGYGQKSGRQYEATNVTNAISDKEATMGMDIAKAYPAEAGISSWQRKVALNRQKNRVEITDAYTMNQKPSSIQQVFMTVCKVDTSVPGSIVLTTPTQKNYVLRYDPKQWSVATEYPSTEGMEYSSFKTKWDSHPVQRILLTDKALKKKGQFVFTVENQ
jgi:hypothetical protein